MCFWRLRKSIKSSSNSTRLFFKAVNMLCSLKKSCTRNNESIWKENKFSPLKNEKKRYSVLVYLSSISGEKKETKKACIVSKKNQRRQMSSGFSTFFVYLQKLTDYGHFFYTLYNEPNLEEETMHNKFPVELVLLFFFAAFMLFLFLFRLQQKRWNPH